MHIASDDAFLQCRLKLNEICNVLRQRPHVENPYGTPSDVACDRFAAAVMRHAVEKMRVLLPNADHLDTELLNDMRARARSDEKEYGPNREDRRSVNAMRPRKR